MLSRSAQCRAVHASDPTLSATRIAERVGCSHALAWFAIRRSPIIGRPPVDVRHVVVQVPPEVGPEMLADAMRKLIKRSKRNAKAAK